MHSSDLRVAERVLRSQCPVITTLNITFNINHINCVFILSYTLQVQPECLSERNKLDARASESNKWIDIPQRYIVLFCSDWPFFSKCVSRNFKLFSDLDWSALAKYLCLLFFLHRFPSELFCVQPNYFHITSCITSARCRRLK